MRKTKKKRTENKRRTRKMYIPTIVKRLKRLEPITPLGINRSSMECNSTLDNINSITLTYGESTPDISYKEPRISVPNCLKLSDKKAQDTLLHNARSSKLIPGKDIIAPLQYMSNCWFNCGFMVNFISDRGRIFNRSFRESIIKGKMIDKRGKVKDIRPEKVRHAFGYLAMAIDACLRGDPMMHKLNTNHLILAIYKAIPRKEKPIEIKESKIDEASNPLIYYDALYKFLYGNLNSYPIIRLEIEALKKDILKKYQSFDFRVYLDMRVKMKFAIRNIPFFKEPEKAYKYLESKDLPSIISVEIYNIVKDKDKLDASKVIRKPKTFKIGSVRYVLDSMILRDVTNTHLCALLTYDGRQYGFDGESYSRINPFSWKSRLNTNKRWTFKGSKWQGKGLPGKDGTPIYWNFRSGYQCLFYYRD